MSAAFAAGTALLFSALRCARALRLALLQSARRPAHSWTIGNNRKPSGSRKKRLPIMTHIGRYSLSE